MPKPNVFYKRQQPLPYSKLRYHPRLAQARRYGPPIPIPTKNCVYCCEKDEQMKKLNDKLRQSTANIAEYQKTIANLTKEMYFMKEQLDEANLHNTYDFKEFWSEFIDIYESFPALWNFDSKEYESANLKRIGYERLLSKYKEVYPAATIDIVQSKISQLQANYQEELNKIREDGMYEPILWCFDLLRFLPDLEYYGQDDDIVGMSETTNMEEMNEYGFSNSNYKKDLCDDDDDYWDENDEDITNDFNPTPSKFELLNDKEYWTDFIEMYRLSPALWNQNCPQYKNKRKRAQCYKQLVAKLKEIDPTADLKRVQKKICTFRTNYRREQRRIKNGNQFYKTKLWYFNLFHFINDFDQTTDSDE